MGGAWPGIGRYDGVTIGEGVRADRSRSGSRRATGRHSGSGSVCSRASSSRKTVAGHGGPMEEFIRPASRMTRSTAVMVHRNRPIDGMRIQS